MSKHPTILALIKYTFSIQCLIIFSSHFLIGQSNVSVNYLDTSSSDIFKLPENLRVKDSLELLNKVSKDLQRIRNEGYLAGSIDRIYELDSTWIVDVFVGNKYSLGKLSVSEIEKGILEEADYRLLDFENKPLSASLISQSMNKLIKALSDNGYPFASAQLKNSKIETDGKLEADLTVTKGQLVLIDSLNIYGGGDISTRYLEKYLEIEPGDRYNEQKILDIKSKIKQLPFLKMDKNPTVSFFNDEAVINLNLKNANASRFDFIIGLLQNESADRNRFTFIYDFSAEMQNKLGAGEQLFLRFRRVQPEIQELDVNFEYPYLLNLPFGVDFEFSLYRNTTLNLDLDADVGIQYFLGGNNYVKASWDYFSSNLLDVDTTQILRTGRLPDRLSVSFNALGLTANIENLDYRFNPRRGFATRLDFSAGIKTINENQEITNLKSDSYDFSAAYDSLGQDGLQLDIVYELDYFIPIGSRSTIKTSLRSGLKSSRLALFQNELFRLGGNKNLRGFDEETIFSDFFNIITLEYRLLLGENSYLSAFGDYGFVRIPSLGDEPWDQPLGIGAGLNFETAAGVFGISTAVGSRRDQAFNLRNAKIHFGYISLF